MRAGIGYDVMDSLRRLALPTLIVAGAEDRLIPPAATRAIADAVPAAQFVEIAGCGHMVAVEQPLALADALDPFLETYRVGQH